MPRKPRIVNEAALEKRRQQYQFHKRKHEKDDNMGTFHVLMVVSFFVSIFIILYQYPLADITILEFFKLICLLIGVSFLIPIKLYRKKLTMSIYEYIISNIISFTPVACALFFILNISFRGAMYEESYKIVHMERGDEKIVFTLENDQYADRVFLRSIHDKEVYEKEGNQYLSIYLSDGLFGMRIIEKKKLH